MRTGMLAAAVALGALAAMGARASDWVAVETPEALRALYSDRTFKGKDWMDRAVVAYYRRDGQGLMLFKGTQIPLRWSVKGRDQVCVVWSAHHDCYRVQRRASQAGTLLLTDVSTDFKAVYTVEDGVPDF